MNLQLKTNVVKWDDAIKRRRLWDQDGFGNLNVLCISQSKPSGFLYAIRRSTLEKLDVVKCKVINSQCPICILDCEATQIHLIKIITGVSRLRNSAVKCWSRIICICHIHNYTEYNQQWNVFSAFNPSECTHTWSSGQPTLRCPGSSWGFSALLKPTTSGYKSDALSIRPRLPPRL